MTTNLVLGFLPTIGGPELIVFCVIGLLLFGKRLPEVARSLGKGIVEFKKGVKGIEEEIHQSSYQSSSNNYSRPSPASRPTASDEVNEVTAPKFEPPTSEPTQAESTQQA